MRVQDLERQPILHAGLGFASPRLERLPTLAKNDQILTMVDDALDDLDH